MDILNALESLEEQEKEKRAADAKKRGSKSTPKKKTKVASGKVSSGASKRAPINPIKPQSQPAPETRNNDLVAPTSAGRASDETDGPRGRERSVVSDRRISFAEPVRPSTRRYYIYTKSASLASGFPYDPRLVKYNVTEPEWKDFSDAVVDYARVPGPSFMWPVNKKDVIKRIKKDLQYESDIKRLLKAWNNRNFKRKGFTAWLELPVQSGEPPRSKSAEPGESSEDDKEPMKEEKSNMKKFRMVIGSTQEKAASVYSRSSSLTRSVAGEGANMEKKAEESEKRAVEEAEKNEEEVKNGVEE